MSRGEVKAKRWKFWQVSLRSLLLLMLVVAAFLAGWTANEFNRRAKPVPVNVKVVRMLPDQQLRKMIENQKLLDRWEMIEQQNRNRQPMFVSDSQR